MAGPDQLFELRRIVTEDYRIVVPRAFLRVPHDAEERSRFLHRFFLERSGDAGRDATARSRRAAQERFEESYRRGRAAHVEEHFVLNLETDGVRATGSLLLAASPLDLSTRERARAYTHRVAGRAGDGIGIRFIDLDPGGYAVAEVRKRIEEGVLDGADVAALGRETDAHLPADVRAERASARPEDRAAADRQALTTCTLDLALPHPSGRRSVSLRLTTRDEALFSPLSTIVFSIAESLQFAAEDGWAGAFGAAAE